MMRTRSILVLALLIASAVTFAYRNHSATPDLPTIRAALPTPGGARILTACNLTTSSPAWVQHPIHRSIRGTDGVKLADFDGDGDLDVVSPWEQGARVTLSLNPGPSAVRSALNWPTAEIIAMASAEGACIGDLDHDGRLDIVGTPQTGGAPEVRFGPALNADLLTPSAWTTMSLTAYAGLNMGWMTCAIADVDGDSQNDLILGGETGIATGEFSWIKGPAAGKRTAANWTPRSLIETTGRTMSIWPIDIEPDGDIDLLASTRSTPNVGVFVSVNNGSGTFTRRTISKQLAWHGNTHMFMLFRPGDIDADGDTDVCAANETTLLQCLENVGNPGDWLTWRSTMIPAPTSFGNNTATAIGDLNLDGYPDIIQASYDAAAGTQSGLIWRSGALTSGGIRWARGEIEGTTHATISKWDEIELLDADGDGDLDIIAGNQGNEDGVVDAAEGLWLLENSCKN